MLDKNTNKMLNKTWKMLIEILSGAIRMKFMVWIFEILEEKKVELNDKKIVQKSNEII